MRDTIRVAAVQMNPRLREKEYNLHKILESVQTAAQEGDADLVVFPECALTGYCFIDLDEARYEAESIPGPSTELIERTCREMEIHAVVGLLEQEGERVYNAVAFIAPSGQVEHYRKIHLPYLGVDRFLTPGDRPFRVYDSAVGRIGTNICYDANFPESARVMALQGAEAILLPTNWPEGAECTPEFVINTRAHENRVNYVAVNRVGTERGFTFIGKSKIVDYTGRTLVEGSADREEILYADLDLAGAREKHVVLIPKEYEIDRIHDRRKEFYGMLVR